jgi:hypothetical protein
MSEPSFYKCNDDSPNGYHDWSGEGPRGCCCKYCGKVFEVFKKEHMTHLQSSESDLESQS